MLFARPDEQLHLKATVFFFQYFKINYTKGQPEQISSCRTFFDSLCHMSGPSDGVLDHGNDMFIGLPASTLN